MSNHQSTRSRAVEWLSIGKLAQRTGLSITAIRFYETQGLITAQRNSGGQRRFLRADIRRLSFIKICQNLGFSLADINQVLAKLPDNRTPTKRDWEILSRKFDNDIQRRIEALTQLRENLTGCIGCGCLSLVRLPEQYSSPALHLFPDAHGHDRIAPTSDDIFRQIHRHRNLQSQ